MSGIPDAAATGLVDCGHGCYGLRDEYVALLHGIDAVVRDWARERQAVPRRYPALIATETLLKTAYYDSFPSQAMFAEPAMEEAFSRLRSLVAEGDLGGRLTMPGTQLRPTLCYHVYEELAGAEIPEGTRTFTVFGRCYRHEDTEAPLRRQREFSMREIVCVGEPDAIAEERERLRERSETFARELGLAPTVEVATDPFWGAANRGKLWYQKERGLKWELQQRLDDGTPLAIASFNLHEDTFSRAFDIRHGAVEGGLAATGCAGWGYERWIAALVDRHGPEPGGWPEAVGALVDRGAERL